MIIFEQHPGPVEGGRTQFGRRTGYGDRPMQKKRWSGLPRLFVKLGRSPVPTRIPQKGFQKTS